MGARQRPGHAPAPRLRGPGARALQRRLERFLQLCAEDNIQVAMRPPRRSISTCCAGRCARNFRKPLIVMTPKSLLAAQAGRLARRPV